MGIPWVYPLEVRHVQRSMPSTAWLMPSDKFWGKDEILVERPGKNYTVYDYKQFFMDINYTDAWYMRKDTANLVRSLTPPGVEVHCLHGYNVPTAGKLVYTDDTWPDKQPKITIDNGDGTVNIRSLMGCLLWQGKQLKKIYHHQVKGADHMEILKNEDVIAYLKKILTRGHKSPTPSSWWLLWWFWATIKHIAHLISLPFIYLLPFVVILLPILLWLRCFGFPFGNLRPFG